MRVDEPAVLIRLNRTYRDEMSKQALYSGLPVLLPNSVYGAWDLVCGGPTLTRLPTRGLNERPRAVRRSSETASGHQRRVRQQSLPES